MWRGDEGLRVGEVGGCVLLHILLEFEKRGEGGLKMD